MAKTRAYRWSPAALDDLDEIWRYNAGVASPDIADQIVGEIYAASKRFLGLKTPGRPRDELLPGLRSIRTRSYTIFLRIADERIEFVRVVHERRDVPELFKDVPE